VAANQQVAVVVNTGKELIINLFCIEPPEPISLPQQPGAL